MLLMSIIPKEDNAPSKVELVTTRPTISPSATTDAKDAHYRIHQRFEKKYSFGILDVLSLSLASKSLTISTMFTQYEEKNREILAYSIGLVLMLISFISCVALTVISFAAGNIEPLYLALVPALYIGLVFSRTFSFIKLYNESKKDIEILLSHYLDNEQFYLSKFNGYEGSDTTKSYSHYNHINHHCANIISFINESNSPNNQQINCISVLIREVNLSIFHEREKLLMETMK